VRIAIWLEQDESGGVSTHLITLLENWPDPDDEVFLFTNSNNPGLPEVISKSGPLSFMKIIVIGRLRSNCARRKILEVFLLPIYLWWCARNAKRTLKREGAFDVFLANNGGYPGSWPTLGTLLAAKKLGIPQRILLVHHQAVKKKRVVSVIESCVDRSVEKFTTGIVSVSNATQKTLIERRNFDPLKVPMHVVLNGMRISGEVDKTRLRKAYNIEDKKILIGIVGRVVDYKGHDDLIQAVAKLPTILLNNTKLLIIGTIEEERRREIENLAFNLKIRENILITGFLETSSEKIIAGLDILVSATRDFEGFGLTILEAMAVGTPIIATDVGGVSEFFDNRFGRLISPMDIDGLTNAICAVIDCPRVTDMRTASAKIRSLDFSAERNTNEMYKIIRPII
jgi:glycosyltransferase involved in cell wall biosynthesis